VSFRHLPVVDRDLGCFHLLPLGQTTRIKILDLTCVCDNCLLFEITDETMDGAWADEVGEKEGVAPDSLGSQHHEAHEASWSLHLEEDEKVHALIVAFFKKRFDPGYNVLMRT
jgi:hypothetical protein